ncbi:hypothetical protein K443DRAFT_572255 [Laccaria amethystina LaAM-08-1]|uniref:Uncharacterized protein n=1 Tax=Laccaria amethystina LaAM-08-1 TaxID=1095629 RepID=A0A0C9X8E4_9AGAR|nr:hypothetical protein K443DRAFT_572255 [Laccaria amethystina LaAM-08-1]
MIKCSTFWLNRTKLLDRALSCSMGFSWQFRRLYVHKSPSMPKFNVIGTTAT